MKVTTTYLSQAERDEAINWLSQIFPSDREEINEASDELIRGEIEKHYAGGLRQFLSDLD